LRGREALDGEIVKQADQKSKQTQAVDALDRVFQVLDRESFPYCVLHGYEGLHREVNSDVDCLISRNVTPRQLLRVLTQNREFIGADVVSQRDYYFVLAIPAEDGGFRFLQLDFSTDCAVAGATLISGEEILASRRRHGRFWVPAPDIEFAAYLVRVIIADKLTDWRAQRLARAFAQDPAAAKARLTGIFEDGGAQAALSAATSGNWESIRKQIPEIARRLRHRSLLRHPVAAAVFGLRMLLKKVERLIRPSGVSVVLLGPDGAGKSSVVSALPAKLAGVLPSHVCWGFVPGLKGLFGRGGDATPTDTPHLLAPRSAPVAVLRVCYWFVFNIISRFLLRSAVAHSRLVMYDRHFIDILVDQRRYRYAGPRWIIRGLCRLAPTPDLVILLDAPASVLQSRKQEVPFEVTVAQCAAYRKLLREMSRGEIIDAAQPFEAVVNDVASTVLDLLRRRLDRSQISQAEPPRKNPAFSPLH
jgi:thymidylate kinase